VIDDDVSLLQGVTLGGTGKEKGDRHPKIRKGVLIGAGAKILGNIEIGQCSRVAAGSVVLKPVAPNTTVAGPYHGSAVRNAYLRRRGDLELFMMGRFRALALEHMARVGCPRLCIFKPGDSLGPSGTRPPASVSAPDAQPGNRARRARAPRGHGGGHPER
jgi:hypothetical protein